VIAGLGLTASIILFCLQLWITPTQAQSLIKSQIVQAPVIVDGQEVFLVSQTDGFTAQERADLINAQLSAVIESRITPLVQVEERNFSPVIVANSRYLLTVTEQDAQKGSSPAIQAAVWTESLQIALQQAYDERRPRYLLQTLVRAGLVLVTVVLATWILRRLWHRLIHQRLLRWVSQYQSSTVDLEIDSQNEQGEQDAEIKPVASGQIEGLSQLLSFVLLLVQLGIWVVAILHVATLFPLSRQWSYQIGQALHLTFTASFFNLGGANYSIVDLLILLLMFWGLVVGTSAATTLLRNRILTLTRMSRGAQEVISAITRYILIFFGTIALLQAWGLDLSSLALLGGALGVGIGFGLQDIARDFSSGLVLLFERSIQAGDFIEVDNHMGTVERVGARSILLRTLDQISIIVPNSAFINNNVVNWSHGSSLSRLRLAAPVAYGSDLEVVRSCLLMAAHSHAKIAQTPTPQVMFLGYGDNALNLELFVWITEPSQQVPITSELFFKKEEQFRKYQVQVPFPQRDLHVQTAPIPLAFSPETATVFEQLLASRSLENPKPEPPPSIPPHIPQLPPESSDFQDEPEIESSQD
jgi:small-conductance mechanosensitive channel